MTEQAALGEPGDPELRPLPRAMRRGPRTRATRPTRTGRRKPAPQIRRLAEWHHMSPGERHVAWSQLRAWVTWLHDRYELGVEGRLPHCWPQHPGLVEELWALKAWREEIYEASQPSGQAARYWHTELRQVIQAATTFYAAGCRTGHRSARDPAADNARLQQRWAAASPLTGIPAADLAASLQRNEPRQWLSPAAMAGALDNGRARELSTALPDYIRCDGSWWRPGAGGWTRVTDTTLTTRLDSWASQLAQADAQATRRLAKRAPGVNGGGPAEPAAPGDTSRARPT